MLKNKNLLFIVSLMLIVTACSAKCEKISYSYCPSYPIAGEIVATELEKVSFEEAPAFWEWLGRIDKLRQELELCR